MLQQIGQKAADKEEIAGRVASDPALVAEVLHGLGAGKASVKYGCARVLVIISEKTPGVLYPHIHTFIQLLDSTSNVLKWTGIRVVGNLAAVDREKKIDQILSQYLEPIRGPGLITAANVILGGARIGTAKPYLADRIAAEILKVEQANYQTPECRNVALSHAINSLDQLFDHLEKKQMVVDLIRRQLDNPRNSVRKRAQEMLNKRQYQSRTTRRRGHNENAGHGKHRSGRECSRGTPPGQGLRSPGTGPQDV